MLFDSTNPAAWDAGAHGQHQLLRTLSVTCGFCVRAAAAATSPSRELLDVVAAAAIEAGQVELRNLEGRCANEEQRSWARQWPGEHYRLLSALVRSLAPALVVEVGTFTGMGTLALLDGSTATKAPGGTGPAVVTYDVLPWDAFPTTVLRSADFGPGMAEQRLGDLSDDAYFSTQNATLAGAGLIFVDGPKDGRFEPIFLSRLLAALRGSRHVVVLDDIHFLNMVNVWNDFRADKLDITSLGHWSGTGLLLTS